MIRFEIILDQTIEDVLLEILQKDLGIEKFTLITPVKGSGLSGPRMGDHIWPEENSMFIIYTSGNKRGMITESLLRLRELYPQNGIAVFISSGAEEL